MDELDTPFASVPSKLKEQWLVVVGDDGCTAAQILHAVTQYMNREVISRN
jgi:hypothetical protein